MRNSNAIPLFDWGDIVVNLSVVRLTYCPLCPKTKTAKGGNMVKQIVTQVRFHSWLLKDYVYLSLSQTYKYIYHAVLSEATCITNAK